MDLSDKYNILIITTTVMMANIYSLLFASRFAFMFICNKLIFSKLLHCNKITSNFFFIFQYSISCILFVIFVASDFSVYYFFLSLSFHSHSYCRHYTLFNSVTKLLVFASIYCMLELVPLYWKIHMQYCICIYRVIVNGNPWIFVYLLTKYTLHDCYCYLTIYAPKITNKTSICTFFVPLIIGILFFMC